MIKILFFAGSTHVNSYNKRLAKLAANVLDHPNVETKFIDLKDYPMPLYDADLEQSEGLPTPAKALQDLMAQSDAIFIASPEYNGSVTGVLKNAIDWVTRSESASYTSVAFANNVIALSSTSPGKLGGIRGLVHLHSILHGLGATIIPSQLSIPFSNTAFDETGRLVDATQLTQLSQLVMTLAETSHKITQEVSYA